MVKYLEIVMNKRYAICFILLLCLVIRLGLVIHRGNSPLVGDERNYVQIARYLTEGKGFISHFTYYAPGEVRPSAHGDPIYPFLLSLVFRAFGVQIFLMYLLQALLDTLTCFVIFKTAYKFAGGKTAGVLAAFGYAIYLPIAMCVATALTETVSIFLILSSIYTLVSVYKKSYGYYALAGALLGLTILTKPAVLLFPLFVGIILFTSRAYITKWLPKAAVYILAAYLVVSPWTIRNYIVLHSFIPVATHGGATFWGGTGPADGKSMPFWGDPLDTDKLNKYKNPSIPHVSDATYERITKLQNRLKKMDEAEIDKTLTTAAIDEIKQHPGRFAYLAIKKFFRLWFNLWHDEPPSKRSLAFAMLNFIIIIFAVKGFVKSKPISLFKHLVLCYAVYTTLISMATFAVARYSFPVFPFLLILASAAICNEKMRVNNSDDLLVREGLSK